MRSDVLVAHPGERTYCPRKLHDTPRREPRCLCELESRRQLQRQYVRTQIRVISSANTRHNSHVLHYGTDNSNNRMSKRNSHSG